MLRRIISKFFITILPIDFLKQSADVQNFLKLAKNNGINTILDIGANTGQYAELLFEHGYDGKIVSFEPLTEAHKVLLQKEKSFPNWIIADRCALGEMDKEVTIHISKNLKSSSILPMLKMHSDTDPESRYVSSENVPMFTLDTIGPKYLDEDAVIFLKMDVQGYEKNVLAGAEDLFNRIKGIQLECSLSPLYDGELLLADLIKKIEGRGFRLYDIIPGFRDPASGILLQTDCIFLKKTA